MQREGQRTALVNREGRLSGDSMLSGTQSVAKVSEKGTFGTRVNGKLAVTKHSRGITGWVGSTEESYTLVTTIDVSDTSSRRSGEVIRGGVKRKKRH